MGDYSPGRSAGRCDTSCWEFKDLARDLKSVFRLSTLLFGTTVCVPLWAAPVSDPLLEEFLRAADQRQCIENVGFRIIRKRGAGNATAVVHAALAALAERQGQQRALGCTGDIAVQAIAAGANPEQVLEATAAGL